MKIFFRITGVMALLVVALGITGGTLYAQFTTPYTSGEGIADATARAKDSLNADAILVGIGTTGDRTIGGFDIEGFNEEDGKSAGWLYIFYSPSLDDSRNYVVVDIPVLGKQVFTDDTDILEFPDEFAPVALNLAGQFSGSAAFAAQLRGNEVYQDYMEDFPGMTPDFVVLTEYSETAFPDLPTAFPTDRAIWGITYGAEASTADSTLSCLVASGTGQTLCTRIVTTSVDGMDAITSDMMTIAPNPARGMTRLELAPDAHLAGASSVMLHVFDAAGRKVMDLTDNLAGNGYLHAEFDAAVLPAGMYFCYLVVDGSVRSWNIIIDR